MKKTFLILLIIISSYTFSQNLSLNDLIAIRSKSISETEEFLTLKNWEYTESEVQTDSTFASANFNYNATEDSDFAESFVRYFTYEYNTVDEETEEITTSHITRIGIQISKKTKYLEYLNAVKAFNAKLISDEIQDSQIVKIYQGATITFIFTSFQNENYYGDEKQSWTLLLLTNEDYNQP